jgi:uncharacterized protein (TIGR03435 family)
MPRITGLVFVLATFAAAPAFTQEHASFEVATIKPTDPAFGGILVGMPNGQFSARGFTLRDLISFAYSMDNRQVVDLPKGLESERYDILGKFPSGAPANPAAARGMLQALLAERFQLTFHRETRDMPIYTVTVAKGGHKMKARTEGDGGEARRMLFNGPNVPGRDVSVAMLAEGLQKLVLDRPIVDKTGLTGNFDFELHWRPEASQFGGRGGQLTAASVNDDKPDIFTAMQEQLGLKLEPTKGPAEVIVVERAEKPSEN